MKPEIRYATLKDAHYVAQNLKFEDRMELAGLGHTAFQVVLGYLFCEESFTFTDYNGELAGIGGVIPDQEGNAYIWVLCTPAITKMGLTFFRQAKAKIDEITEGYNMVYALCDSRNKLHHRFLKFLGFKALRAIPQEPYYIPYYEVVKLCVSQQQQSLH